MGALRSLHQQPIIQKKVQQIPQTRPEARVSRHNECTGLSKIMSTYNLGLSNQDAICTQAKYGQARFMSKHVR